MKFKLSNIIFIFILFVINNYYFLRFQFDLNNFILFIYIIILFLSFFCLIFHYQEKCLCFDFFLLLFILYGFSLVIFTFLRDGLNGLLYACKDYIFQFFTFFLFFKLLKYIKIKNIFITITISSTFISLLRLPPKYR